MTEPAMWLAFSAGKLLVYEDHPTDLIPHVTDFSNINLHALRQQYLGTLNGQHCFSVELADDISPPAGMALRGRREIFMVMDEECIALAGRRYRLWIGTGTTNSAGDVGPKRKICLMNAAKNALLVG